MWTYASIAADCINLRAIAIFNDVGMAATTTSGTVIDAFDHTGSGSHKYIPADRLTQDLGEPDGAGVYGFWSMADGSYLLLTCHGALAHWSGKPEDAAQWGRDK